jgi:hypothetical protein
MKTMVVKDLSVTEEPGNEAMAHIAGGMMPLYEYGRPGFPPEGDGGAGDQPYSDSAESMRYGAGPWDSGYGSPTL